MKEELRETLPIGLYKLQDIISSNTVFFGQIGHYRTKNIEEDSMKSKVIISSLFNHKPVSDSIRYDMKLRRRSR